MSSKKSSPEAEFLDRVYHALYNARTQVKVLGTETDEVNVLIVDNLTKTMAEVQRKQRSIR